MKKILFLLAMLPMFVFSACSDDDDFDYPMETLYGTWDVTDVKVEGKWYDVTTYPYTRFGMSISFKSDGSFYGRGYLGNGSGTYKASGNTIVTYLDGEEYIRYTVKSLSGDNAELTMSMDGESLVLRLKSNKLNLK